jgi:hypothetical protein
VTGTPLLEPVPGGFAIIWQEHEDGPAVSATAFAQGARVPEGVWVDDGLLVGTVAFDGRAHVVTLAPGSGRLAATTVAYSFLPPVQPIIIQRMGSTALAVVPTGVAPMAADVRIHEGQAPDGAYALVAWWSDPRHVELVEIDPDGPVLPVGTVATSGRADYPPSAVNEAIRIVRDR